MLFLLSPAKTLDYETRVPAPLRKKATEPLFTAQAAELINDGDTVGLMGGGGGLMEATHLFEAVQARFLSTQHPRNLTLMHALGIGDKATRGMNCFAHEGLVKRVIGGHWVWSPRMQQLARDNKIEAYILPGGVSSQLFRAIGGGQVLAVLSGAAGPSADSWAPVQAWCERSALPCLLPLLDTPPEPAGVL